MTLSNIEYLLHLDIKRVNTLILDNAESELAAIKQVIQKMMMDKSKRLQIMVFLLSVKAVNYQGEQHVHLASIIDFIYMAMRLHDGVSRQRKQFAAASSLTGDAARILLGDFLYSRAFNMMTEIKQTRVIEMLSHAINRHSESKVLQLDQLHKAELTETEYLNRIDCKASILFTAVTHLAAVIAQSPTKIETALADYGLHLGMATQMSQSHLDRLKKGEMSLLTIRAMQVGSAELREHLCQAMNDQTSLSNAQLLAEIKTTDAFEYVETKQAQEIQQAQVALEELPDSPYRDALYAMTDLSVGGMFHHAA
jgi:octaprenyl-diphosphate synthase